MYDTTVFDKIRTLMPSGRGEMEITDVNNAYIREGTMSLSYLDGWWTDAGAFDSRLRPANLVAKSGARQTPLRLGQVDGVARVYGSGEADSIHGAIWAIWGSGRFGIGPAAMYKLRL